MNDLLELKKNIIEKHNKDQAQLQFIFSNYDKIIVEAPAGSGKTKTLISKIFYLIVNNKIPLNKKVLTLTFGLNAAYKIKNDLSNEFNKSDSLIDINNKIVVSNFHGFARKILSLYGYIIDSSLSNVYTLEMEDDSDVQKLMEQNLGITETIAQWITDFSQKIKSNTINHLDNQDEFKKYIEYQKTFFLPHNKLTYNGLLIFAYELLNSNQTLLKFYQKLFPIIIIDEFQDTNILSWDLLQLLITPRTKLFLLGDPLQRIYGFIGAIENLMEIAQKKYSMRKICLNKNYRYQNNQNLLTLDNNIRLCAASYGLITPTQTANIELLLYDDIHSELTGLGNYIKFISNQNSSEKTTVLTRAAFSVQPLIEELNSLNVNFFYALFSEDDVDYINFHYNAYNSLIEYKNRINKDILTLPIIKKWLQDFIANFHKPNKTESSLIKLLTVLINNVLPNNALSFTEKYRYLEDSLLNRSLKHNIQFIDESIIISTIHGAKGLEWENVILVGLNDYSFPSYKGLCENCYNYRKHENGYCYIMYNKAQTDKYFIKKFIEELSVFYVGATRCRKKLTLVANKKRKNSRNEICDAYMSCLLTIKGLNVNIKPNFYCDSTNA